MKIVAQMIRGLLLPLSGIYAGVMAVRNWCFDRGWKTERSYDVPVINVGNLTVGGTGKTPQVEWMLRLLLPMYRVAVLSRGYGRKTKGFRWVSEKDEAWMCGDEPLQIKRKYVGALVAVCENRCVGMERILAEHEVDVVVLDDAFQHRYVRPSLNVMLTDYSRLYTRDWVLPAGRLREMRRGAKRADVIVVTKCPLTLTEEEARGLEQEVRRKNGQKVFFSGIGYGAAYRLAEQENDKKRGECFAEKEYCSILALTGIAKNENFLLYLQQWAKRMEVMAFADHHRFSAEDAAEVQRVWRQMPQKTAVVTTEKDAMRLEKLKAELGEELWREVWVQPIESKVLLQQEKVFKELIINHICVAHNEAHID